MTEVYLVVHEDRHIDIGITVYEKEEDAMREAKEIAEENWCEVTACPEDSEGVIDNSDSWLYFCAYNGEGDCVHVEKTNIIYEEPNNE